jgi:hypothetical protein
VASSNTSSYQVSVRISPAYIFLVISGGGNKGSIAILKHQTISTYLIVESTRPEITLDKSGHGVSREGFVLISIR